MCVRLSSIERYYRYSLSRRHHWPCVSGGGEGRGWRVCSGPVMLPSGLARMVSECGGKWVCGGSGRRDGRHGQGGAALAAVLPAAGATQVWVENDSSGWHLAGGAEIYTVAFLDYDRWPKVGGRPCRDQPVAVLSAGSSSDFRRVEEATDS
jgi:hypothetical protein